MVADNLVDERSIITAASSALCCACALTQVAFAQESATGVNDPVHLQYAFQDDRPVCDSLLEVAKGHSTIREVFDNGEVWSKTKLDRAEPIEMLSVDIDHNGVPDTLASFHWSRAAKSPVYEVNYTSLHYRLSPQSGVIANPETVSEIAREGGSFVRLELGTAAASGSRPHALTESMSLTDATVMRLLGRYYLLVTYPTWPEYLEKSIFLINFLNSEPYIACQIRQTKR